MKKNVLFISLGCDKNLVDSEKMIGLLQESNYQITEDEEKADAIVVNTCCFIDDAKEESIETILEMSTLKETANLKALVVTGCMAQRYEKEIEEAIPEVDAIIGTGGANAIVEYMDKILEEKAAGKTGVQKYMPSIDDVPEIPPEKRALTAGTYSTYMKISEGCDKRCSYCVIPSVRGHYRSFPMENLVKEAEYLAKSGVKELILIAQETTVYGVDLYGRKTLPELLDRLSKIEGIEWIRLLYCYPEEITDELIETIKNNKKVCHYLDMPVQHSEDHILRKMGRRTSRAELENLVTKLRREIPDIVLRTTMITGFPGETEAESDAMAEFIDQMEFERLGAFTYSAEEGTVAATMPDQIDEEVKDARRDKIMTLQQQISAEFGQSHIGQIMDVLVEGYLFEEGIYIGRTYMDAPKVDGNVFIHAEEELISGDIVPVKITGASEYDLMGDVVYADEFTK